MSAAPTGKVPRAVDQDDADAANCNREPTRGQKAMEREQSESPARKLDELADRLGHRLVNLFEMLALFVIGGTIVWAAVAEYIDMIERGRASIHDILLLFIYLELGAMVGIYFRTNRLPVEFLLFLAITVITRTLVQVEELNDTRVMVLTGAVLVLAIAVLLLHYGVSRLPIGARPRATDLGTDSSRQSDGNGT
jgi:phosphate starvation-inducible membrane PsiE